MYTIEISLIAIVEEYRRTGIGYELTNMALDYCRNNNIIYITVKTIDDGILKNKMFTDFLFGIGFVPLEILENYYNNHNATIMIKHINKYEKIKEADKKKKGFISKYFEF